MPVPAGAACSAIFVGRRRRLGRARGFHFGFGKKLALQEFEIGRGDQVKPNFKRREPAQISAHFLRRNIRPRNEQLTGVDFEAE